MAVKVRKIEKKEVEAPNLPELISKAQKDSNKSVSILCREIGFTRTYWYRLVNGQEKVIAVETLRKIEEILNTNFEIDL